MFVFSSPFGPFGPSVVVVVGGTAVRPLFKLVTEHGLWRAIPHLRYPCIDFTAAFQTEVETQRNGCGFAGDYVYTPAKQQGDRVWEGDRKRRLSQQITLIAPLPGGALLVAV